jgi:hypothetical protein
VRLGRELKTNFRHQKKIADFSTGDGRRWFFYFTAPRSELSKKLSPGKSV